MIGFAKAFSRFALIAGETPAVPGHNSEAVTLS